MKNKLISIITAVATTFFFAAGINVQAEEIVIQKGDTLWDLSKQYNTSVESIKKWNNLTSDLIYANDTLEVSPIKNLTIREGDTLWNISQVYGVSVDDLMKWNELSSDLVHPGLGLVIYTNLHNEIGQEELQADSPSTQTEETTATEVEQTENITEEAATPEEPVEVESATSEESVGKEIIVDATAYTAECQGCSGITKTGVDLKANPNEKVIAVDPAVIPLGTKVHVEGFGYATAEDIGGGINGNEIDIFMPEHDDAIDWGRKQVKVTIID